MATSHHSKEYYKCIQQRQAIGITEPERSDAVADDPTPLPLDPLPQLSRLKSDPDDQQDENETEEEQPPPDNQTLLRLLPENEKASKSFNFYSSIYPLKSY